MSTSTQETMANAVDPRRVDSDFCTALMQELLRCMYSDHPNNVDYDRFSDLKPSSGIKHWLAERLKRFASRNKFHLLKDEYGSSPAVLEQLKPHLAGYSWLYRSFADDSSRQLWLKLLAYRVLGSSRVLLPINTPHYRECLARVKAAASTVDQVPIRFMNWRLPLIDLHSFGTPIRLYCMPLGVQCTYIYQQYRYRWSSSAIEAKSGETVIDCGGCWGDSALYFANAVGPGGRVLTMEFIPTNLDILHKNLALNPALSPCVTVVDSPVWERSGVTFYSCDNGPGSRVSSTPSPELDLRSESVSIDDLIERHSISEVGFIKMDIEGAELPALRGAERTLRRFRPKLAIAVYHSPADYYTIPQWLDSLGLGYRFYMDHFTIYGEETVLFADVPS